MTELRRKHWGITLNNPSVTAKAVAKILSNDTDVENYALQLEKVKTLHLQIYIGYKKVVGRRRLERLLDTTTFHDDRVRHPYKAWLYCQKEESRVDISYHNETWVGTQQGHRTDLDEAADIIKDHGAKAVADHLPGTYIRYHRGLEAFEHAIEKPAIRPKKVYIFWGPTGVGKTTAALAFKDAKRVEYSAPFFDYEPCATAIFDEADGMHLSRDIVLKLTDRFPYRIRIIGGFTTFNPKRIIFISNKEPSEWLQIDEALQRRVTRVRQYTAFDTWLGSDL